MSAEHYDVVVVGAGPAGSIAARTSAAQGAMTLLLERDPVVGTPVRCGEAIARRNLERWVDIQPRWIAVEVLGAVLYAPNGTGVPIESKETTGLILERSLFDRYLAETAAEAGAEVITRANVDGLTFTDEKISGVTYSRFGKRTTVTAKVVIGADGIDSRVARWGRLHTEIRAADLESAYQFYVAGIDYDARYCHFYLGDEFAPGGYIWVFPKTPSMASIGIGVCVKDAEAGMAYQRLKSFIDKRFPKGAIVGEMAGGVPVSRPLKKPFTDGLLLAGDAARHCNPLTGGGIATGMAAGYHAGLTAAECAKSGDTSSRALSVYLDRLEDDVTKPNTRAYRLKEGVNRLTDEMMNRTADEMMALPAHERSLRSAFLIALKNQPLLAVDVIRAFV